MVFPSPNQHCMSMNDDPSSTYIAMSKGPIPRRPQTMTAMRYTTTATNHDGHEVYHDGHSNENVKN